MSQLNSFTRLHDEPCYRNYITRNNEKISNYTIPPSHKTRYNNRNSYFRSLVEPGIYLNDHDGQTTTPVINKDSKLKNGIKGNKFTREQYSIPEGMNVLKRNKDEIHKKVNPDSLSNIYNGKRQPVLKDRLITEHSYKRFIPLIPCIKKDIKQFTKSLPSNDIRAGQDTRPVSKCCDYIASNEWKQ